MTLSLRTRLLAVVVVPFVAIGGLAAANLPSLWVVAGAGVCLLVAAVGVVLLTRPFERLTRYASQATEAARKLGAVPEPPTGGDGTERVRHALTALWQQAEETHHAVITREHEFETALYDVTAALAGLATDARKPITLAPPVCPWPDRAEAVTAAVKAVGGLLANAQRRAAGFQTVLNDLPDPVVVADADHKVLVVNKAAAELYDLESNEAAKRPLAELFLHPPADLLEPEQAPPLGPPQLAAWLSQPNGGGCEAIAATPEEGGTRVQVTVRPPSDRTAKQFTVLLLRDLTRQMKKDSDVRLQHRRQVAQRLCLLIENEAKPALEAIRTNATLLAQAAKQAGQRERFVPKVQRMMDELSRQEVVITLLGWLGRLTKTFGSSQDLGEVRLRAAADEVGEKLTAVYGDRNNELEVTGDAGWLIADEEWVTVLLTGLLLHANLSCKGGKVTAELRRRSLVMADQEQGEVLVRYPGPMLSDEALDDVREPFRRPNSLALESTSELGFPLGLAVANRIAALMGGQLGIEAEGSGCCVRVTLPTRAISSRMESKAAGLAAPVAVTGAESGDLLSEWTVGGQSTGLELVSTATPNVVADTPPPAAEPFVGDTLGDWFPAPNE
ncbi:MAG: PAS domain-containing protein [Fimbriiglobus sp.]|jgi:PAS domain-containing protein|nr:PAS domain-containing protein [Fimbriiglobus sp.]